MKKVLGLLLTVAMLAQLVILPVAVQAAEPTEGWTFTNAGALTTADKRSGDFAMYVEYVRGTKTNGFADFTLATPYDGGTYTVEFYLKVLTDGGTLPPIGITTGSDWQTRPGIGNIWKNVNDGSLDMMVGDADEMGWKKVSYNNYKGTTGNSLFRILYEEQNVPGITHKFYIDDVILYDNDDTSKTNLITNGGFELPDAELISDTWDLLDGAANITNDEVNVITSAESRTGEKSMFVQFMGDGANEMTMYARNLGVSYPNDNADKTYTVEFYIKNVEVSVPRVATMTNNNWKKRARIQDCGIYWEEGMPQMTIGEADEDGWQKVSYSQMQGPSANASGFTEHIFWFMFHVKAATRYAFYIDDVVLYDNDDASKTNLLTGGGFEPEVVIPPVEQNAPVAWKLREGTGGLNEDEINVVTNADSLSGENSMYVEFTGVTTAETTMYAQNTEMYYPADSAGKTYTVEFYVKNKGTAIPRIAVMSNNDYNIRPRVAGCGIWANGSLDMTIGAADANGWQKVSYSALQGPSANISNDTDHYFWFMFHVGKITDKHAFYIDDVVLYDNDDPNKTNLISNGDFESVRVERTAYEPKNMMITNQRTTGDATVYNQVISWRNPVSPALRQVSLYDVTGKTEVLLSNTIATEADAVVNHKVDVTSSADGTKKLYKAVFAFEDGEKREIVLGEKVSKPDNGSNSYKIGNWGFYGAYWNAPGNPPVDVVVDEAVYRTAAPSIKLRSNIVAAKAGYNSELHLYTPEKLTAGKTYRFTMYIKGNNAGYSAIRVGEFGNEISGKLFATNASKNYTEWKKITCDYTPTADTNYGVNIITEYGVEDLWIDDVSFYLVDENGQETGENLFGTAGSADDIEQPDEVTKTEITNGNEKARIAWLAGADANYISVYDGNNLRALVPADYGYVDVVGLTNGETYAYTVKTMSTSRRESANGVVVVLTPEPEKLAISEYAITKNGTIVTVSTNVKNNAMGSGVTAELILAVYDGQTMKQAVSSTMKAVPQSGYYDPATPLTATINVPNGYVLRAFLWNSLTGMQPLKSAEQIQIN
ncbi:MAG: hypothetical protein IKW60_05425 [Clostridia bacterium]|nr:hypothetical protein [Clostridia bacterium]